MHDRSKKQTPLERLLLRLYELSLKSLPLHIRRRWATEMIAMFAARLHEARRRGGEPAVLVAGGRELGSIAFGAFQSRVGQTSGRVHRAHDAQDGSGVWRTDPVSALFFHQQDRRPLKLATMGALACHFALFLVVFPGTATPDFVAPPEDPPWVIQPLPLPPPPQVKGAVRVRHNAPPYPIIDPTPNEPEPLVGREVEYGYGMARDTASAHFEVALPTRPPTAPPERVRAGVDVRLPQLVQRVQPVYPELAVRARLECVVVLEAVIGRNGRIIDTKVLRGCRLGLDESAVDAVRQWQFTPPTLNGRPVEVVGTFTVRFELH